eukprot:scaffold681874_cov31-Prasinocladus_malaysianus.AAC.1
MAPLRASAASDIASGPSRAQDSRNSTHITTSVTARDVQAMKKEIAEAVEGGADIVELRLDFLERFDPEKDIRELIGACPIPKIVTLRPTWEG